MDDQRRQQLDALESPIRSVPWTLRVSLLLGGQLGVFSWGILALTLVFLIPVDWANLLTRSAPLEFSQTKLVPARVMKVRSIEGQSLVLCEFEYTVQGKRYVGQSYTAPHDAMVRQVQHGHMVTSWAKYAVEDPALSRMQGQVLSWTSWTYFLIFAACAVFAMLLVLGNIIAGLGELQLLRRGILTYGRYTRMVPLNPDLEDSLPQYVFVYMVGGSRYEVSAETDDPGSILDEEEEPLLYQPRAPDRAVVFDNLPGHPDVRDGRLTADPKQMLKALIFPLIVIVECVLLILW